MTDSPKTEITDEELALSQEELREYRKGIIDIKHKLSESYDKLIVTLSGGALALSITFLKDIVGAGKIVNPMLLLSAWGAFVLSLATVLGAILFGIQAHKRTIKQIDDGTIYDDEVVIGGICSRFSTWLHCASAISLLAGLIFISLFAFKNMGEENGEQQPKTNTTKTNTTKTNTTSTETGCGGNRETGLVTNTTTSTEATKGKIAPHQGL